MLTFNSSLLKVTHLFKTDDEILGNFKVVMLFSYQGSVCLPTPSEQLPGARQQMVLYHPFF